MDLFLNKRILIIHSGGDSKRIPQYSAFGKLFSKVPRKLPDGRYFTLFDEFLISLSGLPSRMKEGLDADIIYDMLGMIMTDGRLDKEKYDRLVNDRLRLNFYGNFIIHLTSSAILESYLKEEIFLITP